MVRKDDLKDIYCQKGGKFLSVFLFFPLSPLLFLPLKSIAFSLTVLISRELHFSMSTIVFLHQVNWFFVCLYHSLVTATILSACKNSLLFVIT